MAMMVVGKRKDSGFDLERDGEEKQQFRSLWFVLVMFRVKETARWGHYSNWYYTAYVILQIDFRIILLIL